MRDEQIHNSVMEIFFFFGGERFGNPFRFLRLMSRRVLIQRKTEGKYNLILNQFSDGNSEGKIF
jgi:hypothetical protein